MIDSRNCVVMKTDTTKRNSSLDLLRIMCAIMVVCNHMLSWTGIMGELNKPMTPIWIAENILFVLVLPAVNCFVLISGYFLCTSKFRLKKLVSVWGQALVYSVVFYLLACLINKDASFSLLAFLKSFLVVILRRYWFVTAYVLLYIFSPFLNCAIQAMNKRTHAWCCVVLLLVFSFMANLVYIQDFSGVDGGYSFVWFCVLYIIAAYIRLYVPAKVKYQKWMFPASIACSLLICAEKFLAHIITPHIFGTVMMDSVFYSYNSIIAVPCALALFQGFRGVEIRSLLCQKIIGFFAPLTFAVYLIHGHLHFNQVVLDVVDIPNRSQGVFQLLYVAVCTIGIVLVCCLIEWLRQRLFRCCKVDQMTGILCDKIQERVEKWLNASV